MYFISPVRKGEHTSMSRVNAHSPVFSFIAKICPSPHLAFFHLYYHCLTLCFFCMRCFWGCVQPIREPQCAPTMIFWRGEAWQFWAWFRDQGGGRQVNSQRLGRAATSILCLVLCWFSMSVCFSSWASCPSPEPHSFLPYLFCLSCLFLLSAWHLVSEGYCDLATLILEGFVVLMQC